MGHLAVTDSLGGSNMTESTGCHLLREALSDTPADVNTLERLHFFSPVLENIHKQP